MPKKTREDVKTLAKELYDEIIEKAADFISDLDDPSDMDFCTRFVADLFAACSSDMNKHIRSSIVSKTVSKSLEKLLNSLPKEEGD